MNKLQNTNQIFKNALKGNYAIGAFNFVNMEVLKAILLAAEEEKSPVIIQCSTAAMKYAGVKTLVALARAEVENVSVPVVLGLDHGKTFEDCKLAIDSGFTNVMIDASHLPYDENVALTKKVVEYAHPRGVTVEAELGIIAGIEDEIYNQSHTFTNPKQALEFVKATQVDSLAIAIGTSHGTYKFKGKPTLRLDILHEIENLLPNFPLVLHGASSVPQDVVQLAINYGAKLDGVNGVPEHMLKSICKKNICKINVDSDLRLSFTAALRKHFVESPADVDLRNYHSAAIKLTADTVKHKLKNVFGSSNKA